MIGVVPCSSPQIEEENIEEYFTLPAATFGKGDFFVLGAIGHFMSDAISW